MAIIPVIGQFEWGATLNAFLESVVTTDTAQNITGQKRFDDATLKAPTIDGPTFVMSTPNPSVNFQSGWKTSGTMNFRKIGNLGFLFGQAERTGGAITPNNSSNIGNVQVVRFGSGFRPVMVTPLSPGGAGRLMSLSLDTDGYVSIAALGGTNNLSNGDTISFGGTVPLA